MARNDEDAESIRQIYDMMDRDHRNFDLYTYDEYAAREVSRFYRYYTRYQKHRADLSELDTAESSKASAPARPAPPVDRPSV